MLPPPKVRPELPTLTIAPVPATSICPFVTKSVALAVPLTINLPLDEFVKELSVNVFVAARLSVPPLAKPEKVASTFALSTTELSEVDPLKEDFMAPVTEIEPGPASKPP